MDAERMASAAAAAAGGAAGGAAAKAIAGGAILRYLKGKNRGLSAAKSLESKISDQAKEYAATIKTDDSENFFVKYQNFGAAKGDLVAQTVVACLTHQMRGIDERIAMWHDVVQITLASTTSVTLFAASLERLYLLSVLLKFEKSFTLGTLPERIAALKLLKDELTESARQVSDDSSLDKSTKNPFVKSMLRTSEELSLYIEKLELDRLEESILDVLTNISVHLKGINASLVRTIQNLHAPSGDFSALDALSPGLKYPKGLTNKTREALAGMMDVPTARSLFEVDKSDLVGKLYVHRLDVGSSDVSLSGIYGGAKITFFGLISRAYTLQKEIKELINVHEAMRAGVRLFGEIMLAGTPKLKGVIERHVNLIRLMLVRVKELYTETDSAIALSAHRETTRFNLEHGRLIELNGLAEEELVKISISLRSMDREYLRSSLKKFTDNAIRGALLFRKYGGECSDEDIQWLRSLERVLTEHSCEYLSIDSGGKVYIDETGAPDSADVESLKAEFEVFRAEGASALIASGRKRTVFSTPMPVVPGGAGVSAVATAVSSSASHDEFLKSKLFPVLHGDRHLAIMNKAYPVASMSWSKSPASKEAKQQLKNAIEAAVGKDNAPLTPTSFLACDLVMLQAIAEALDRVYSVSRQDKKRELHAMLSRGLLTCLAPLPSSPPRSGDSAIRVEAYAMGAFVEGAGAVASPSRHHVVDPETTASNRLRVVSPVPSATPTSAAAGGAGVPAAVPVPRFSGSVVVESGEGGLSPITGFLKRQR